MQILPICRLGPTIQRAAIQPGCSSPQLLSAVPDPTSTQRPWILYAHAHRPAYLHFASDLAAFDPATHDGTVKGVVFAVMPWLATREGRIPPVTPTQVVAAFPRFRAEKRKTSAAWGGFPPWPEIVLDAIRVAKKL